MEFLNNDFYTIRMSNKNLWNITYNSKFGIVYRQLINNKWSNASILEKQCNNSFTVLPLPKNKLCLIYQKTNGNIVMSVFSNKTWTHKKILKWKGTSIKKANIKAFYYHDTIHIFYSINLTSDSTQILFYQTINSKFNLSEPIVIDNNIINAHKPFDINILDDGSFVVLYEKLVKDYELVYKLFNHQNCKWSDCYTIDKNLKPYKNFSLCCNNNTIHILYIKNDNSQNLLIHCSGLFLDLNYITIFKNSKDIVLPCFFKLKDTIWDMWINNNSIYSCFSKDNGLNVSVLKKEPLPKSLLKTAYFYHNEKFNNKYACTNHLYITPDNGLTFFPTTLSISIKKSYELNHNFKYKEHIPRKQNKCITNIKDNFSSYKEEILNKNEIINQLSSLIQNERSRSSVLFNKLNNIQANYSSLKQKYDTLLNEKSNLEVNNYKINELTTLLLEKNKVISEFKKNFSDLELSKSITLENKNNFEKEIEEYKIIIDDLNSKLKNYEEKIFYLTDELNNTKNKFINKQNSSLLKKFFGIN
ncbi:hypothetical protein [Clostridium niameyense]|uniref:hypothetical protein n=1 Tax=Clostridium niameyense TaxID=1622073 RepID=UPI00067E9F73|nr:hypothetical protein [Clostridium niameyense]